MGKDRRDTPDPQRGESPRTPSETPPEPPTETLRPEERARIPKNIGRFHIKRVIASGDGV